MTSETCSVRPERAKRVEGRLRLWPVAFEPLETAVDYDPLESDTDFGDDDITIPEPLPDATPSWIPTDIGQALIDEWEATAETRAARPAHVSTILRSAAESTAITSIAKLPIRSAS